MSNVNLEPHADIPSITGPVYTESIHHIAVADTHHFVYDGKKTRLFTEFATEVCEQAKSKTDRLIPEAVVRLGAGLKLPNRVGFTPRGLESLASHTRITPRTVQNLREQGYHEVVVQVLNDQLDRREQRHWENIEAQQERGRNPKGEPRQFLLRQREDEQGNTVVRAVASERYGIVDNHHVLDFIQSALPVDFYENSVTHKPFNDGDNMLFNLFLPDQNSDGLHYGLFVRNSEIGDYKFSIEAFLYRSYCTNGCVFGKTGQQNVINVKHVGKQDLELLKERVKQVVQNVLKDGVRFREQFVQAQAVTVAAPVENVIALLSKREGLTIEQGRAWYAGYQQEPAEGQSSLAAQDVVNGLTRGAQLFSGEARFGMERLAGHLLTPSLTASRDAQQGQWSRYATAANTLAEQDVRQFAPVTAG